MRDTVVVVKTTRFKNKKINLYCSKCKGIIIKGTWYKPYLNRLVAHYPNCKDYKSTPSVAKVSPEGRKNRKNRRKILNGN